MTLQLDWSIRGQLTALVMLGRFKLGPAQHAKGVKSGVIQAHIRTLLTTVTRLLCQYKTQVARVCEVH